MAKELELIFHQYGGGFGSAATDWDIYGFGTPAYNKVLLAALQATKDNGLIMDFEMGPQSGQGVPAEIDNRKCTQSFKPDHLYERH
jgi:hypothetical protein